MSAREMALPRGNVVPIAPRLATRSLTVVVPTYQEAENIPHLIDRVAAVRAACGIAIDLLFMDDNSNDGSADIVAARPEEWVRLVVRTGPRGLSEAVLDGFRQARGEVILCMDADLSHPPQAIPQMIAKLEAGADFVFGSRYVTGGSTAHDWGFLRWMNSRVATLLARPLTAVQDPMAGFFALRRSTFEAGRDFNPIGYKIGLELMVKCGCERVVEVPIHFEDRKYGHSKLTMKQQVLYLKHLRRLYIFKYGVWSQLIQFLAVGAMGTAVNLAVLTALLALGFGTSLALALAILGSMCFNFVLNRRFSFAGARDGSWMHQFVRFIAATSVGAAINYGVALLALEHLTGPRPQLAALVGIAVGMLSNFVASRYLVFRTTHIRPE
jgi:dolichol-phosphate mannosyltransferase